VTEADYTSEGYVTTSTGALGSIETNTTQTAAFTNTKAVGSLTIAKTVAGNAGDATKEFEFTLTLNGAAGVYPYTGHGVPDGTIQSGDTLFLAHGQSVTITDLPVDATYTVTESDYTGDGYDTVSTGADGGILEGITQTASFINTKNMPPADGGNLTISKTVTGAAADTTKKFFFRVTLADAPDTYAYTGNGVPDGMIKSKDSIALAHGQSITIEGLPVGATYTVVEADYTGDGYTMSSTGAMGSIEANMTQTAAFTNTKNATLAGALTISKTVTGDLGDKEQAFTFVVNLGAGGSYHYSGSKTGTIQSGQAVALKHGEYITIEGLPVNTMYLVTEKEANQSGYVTSATGASGAITERGQTAAFVNLKSSVPKTGDGHMGVIWGIGLMISALMLLALVGLRIASRTKRRPR
jgi:hypothetical protein